MRVPTILLLSVLALIPSPSAADINRRLDSLVFSVHVDLLSHFDLADLRRALEDARAIFQGSEQAAGIACCTQIDAIELEPKAARKHLKPAVEPVLADLHERLAALDEWTEAALEAAFEDVRTRHDGLPMGRIAQPVRVAITGTAASPGIKQTPGIARPHQPHAERLLRQPQPRAMGAGKPRETAHFERFSPFFFE